MIKESDIGLKLKQSLSPELQSQARSYRQMHNPAMLEGRWHVADQHHLAGATQDNRIIPYENVTLNKSSLYLWSPHSTSCS